MLKRLIITNFYETNFKDEVEQFIFLKFWCTYSGKTKARVICKGRLIFYECLETLFADTVFYSVKGWQVHN